MVAWPSKCFWLRNKINATIENAIIQNTFCKTLIEYSAPLSKFWLHILSDNEHNRCLMNKVLKLVVLKLVGPCRHLPKIYWAYILYFFLNDFEGLDVTKELWTNSSKCPHTTPQSQNGQQDHAKTFQIERLNCIVKFATKVRKTAVSIPIPIKEIIWIHLFELCVYKVKPFSYHSDTFRSSGYSSDHTDNLQIIWTLFESSGFAKTSRSVLLTLWLWAWNVRFSNIKSGLNTLSTMQCKGFVLPFVWMRYFLRA